MKHISELEKILNRINGKGYKAYNDIKGEYFLDNYSIIIDRVQGDPFASPSNIRIKVNKAFLNYPEEIIDGKFRKIAFEDYLARILKAKCLKFSSAIKGSGKSGVLTINAGEQEVIERSSVFADSEQTEIRLNVGLPAAGRKILGDECKKIFFNIVFELVNSLKWDNTNHEKCELFVKTIENHEFIRKQLEHNNLVAFVANGSILPRESGNSQKPLQDAIPFYSPKSLEIILELKNPVHGKNKISGMGIQKGVTTIVGGGFHGKSTLLAALKKGIYPHIPGDGREYVVTNPSAVNIRAEDGRNIPGIDIRLFINNLPMDMDTSFFNTTNASGSTSQSTNILEAIETGCELLLVDEDTSATNFMVRDEKMQALIAKDFEPITPFVEKVRKLYKRLNVSTILVMGGNGDYLGVSDTVLMMKNFKCEDVTQTAKKIYKQYSRDDKYENEGIIYPLKQRLIKKDSFDFIRESKRFKLKAMKTDRLIINKEEIDLRNVEQLVDESQVLTIGKIIKYIAEKNRDVTYSELRKELQHLVRQTGFDFLSKKSPGLTKPRYVEVFAALNRLRKLKVSIQKLPNK